MAGVSIFLCVCLWLQLVAGQFGFFPPRAERRYPSFGFTQNFLPNPNGVRNTLNNLFNLQRNPPNQYDQYRPNQYDQNRPIYNNQYDQNRPINNNQFEQNRPISNNQYDQNYPTNNNQFEQNRPINNNEYDQNRPINNEYDQNGPVYPPNNVRFPNRGGEDIPQDNVNFEPEQPTPETLQPVNVPKEEEMGYGFQNNGDKPNTGFVNNPDENSATNEATSAPLGNNQGQDDQFSNKNGIPTAPPPLPPSTELPKLTPVPPSESRNNFNFGSQGLFKESCTTIEGGIGSCISIVTCPTYVKLLQQVRTNPAAVQVLRKAHCGFEGNNPKVCCPLNSIPNTPPQTAAPPTTTTTVAPVTPDAASGKSLESDFLLAFPAPPECGVSNASFSRVVGGIDAKLGDFPWMALLGYKDRRGSSTRWLCGGSLISSHHVLTAAHCIHNHEEDLYVVRLGELDLAREDEGATPIDVLIKYKIKHEGYNAKSFTNDIGLLILQNDVQFTDLIRPICIPLSSDLRAKSFENYNPIIAGWGDTEFRGPSATHLQVLQLPVVSNDFCKKAYVDYKAQVIDERVLCAGYKKGGKDACQGDSGGPLMQPIYYPQNLTTYFFQIGVVSYGKRCAEAGFPGVYSRVTNFVPWLQENILGRA
ncbi:venom serine protease Bi-VSP-like [Vanessa cardui]|uniref:venom serine protease Bi-VSP-like n=1 Tax=Vanessa cardui TaxID=171605 RepID=UPI001F141C55|nr:venom serine protease Bi-VSP-like [Vanessa cardui]